MAPAIRKYLLKEEDPEEDQDDAVNPENDKGMGLDVAQEELDAQQGHDERGDEADGEKPELIR